MGSWGDGFHLPSLLFTDDILLFGQAHLKSMEAVREALEMFSSFTGMAINHSKSVVVYSKVCSRALTEGMEAIIGVSTKKNSNEVPRPSTYGQETKAWPLRCLN